MTHRLALLYLVAVAFLAWGFAIGRYHAFPDALIEPIYAQVADFIKYRPEVGRSLFQKLTLPRQVRPNRFPTQGWRQADPAFTDPGYLLVSRYSEKHDQVIIELIQLSDFTVRHTWIPPLDDILEEGPSDRSENSKPGYRAQHPFLLPDGSVVFHSGEGPLVRIDKDSNLVWLNPEQFHHSIEMDPDGHLLVPIVNNPPLTDYDWARDDGYAVVSLDGSILKRYSVARILTNNGYRGLYLGIDDASPDRVHLNDVQPIARDAGLAKAGDVALSSRTLSTVFLYRPSTDQVVWLKTGPWLYQHDINPVGDDQYSIFGNNVYYTRDEDGPRKMRLLGHTSQIYLYNPATNTVSTPYADVLASVKMRSSIEGRARILANGDAFIEETCAHRLLRVSPNAVRWEYVNSEESSNRTGALHWSRYLDPDQLDLSWME